MLNRIHMTEITACKTFVSYIFAICGHGTNVSPGSRPYCRNYLRPASRLSESSAPGEDPRLAGPNFLTSASPFGALHQRGFVMPERLIHEPSWNVLAQFACQVVGIKQIMRRDNLFATFRRK